MNANELRKQFLNSASDVVEVALQNFKSTAPVHQMNAQQVALFNTMWPTIDKMLQAVDDPSPIKTKGKKATKQISTILAGVAAGDLTLSEAKAHLELIQMGIDTKELPKLIEALEKAGG